MPHSPIDSAMRRVRDIMKFPVHTLRMDDVIETAQDLFDRHRCHHAVVLDHNEVRGVVSDRDVLAMLNPYAGKESRERSQNGKPPKKPIHQIMSRAPVTIGPDELVSAAAEQMLRKRVSSLPVVDDEQKLVGIITTRDILAWAVKSFGPCASPT